MGIAPTTPAQQAGVVTPGHIRSHQSLTPVVSLHVTYSCTHTALKNVVVVISHWFEVACAALAHHLGDVVDVCVDTGIWVTLGDGGQAEIRVGDGLQE